MLTSLNGQYIVFPEHRHLSPAPQELRHLQGLQGAAGFFQSLSLVGLLHLYRLSAQVSRLSSTGAIVKTLPL